MNLFSKKKETSTETGTESVSTKKKGKRKVSKTKVRIIAAVLVLVLAFGGFFGYKFFSPEKNSVGRQITAVAAVGSVSSVIEGSGTLEALQQYEITSLKKGEVLEDFFEEGDVVNEGDILYRMDDEDGREIIKNAQESVADASEKLNDLRQDVANLNVKSKVSGVVSSLYISKGSNVSSNSKLADVYDNSKMVLEIQFLSDYVSYMKENSSTAAVTLTKGGSVLYGTVTKISTGSIINSVGASVSNVEITVPNPGAVEKGDYATAEVDGYACSSEGKFKYYSEDSIFSEVSGKVEQLNIMVGDKVSYGQLVAVLSNSDLTRSSSSGSGQSIKNAEKSLEKAVDNYNDALESLEDYVVKAPITGTIIQKNIKAGEKLEASTSGGAMAIIADLSSIVFEMSVDELDISKMSVGMDVEVTADAVSGVKFGAKVTSISIVGSSNNGVTSYPVKITLNSPEEQLGMARASYDKLIPGMNVSASVVIEKVENVIVVPVSAVRRGNIVIVREDSTSEGVGFGGVNGNMGMSSAGGNATKSQADTAKSDGNKASYGGNNAAYGGNKGSYGGNGAAYGENKAAYGGNGAAYGENKAAYGGNNAAYGENKYQANNGYKKAPEMSSDGMPPRGAYGNPPSYGSDGASKNYAPAQNYGAAKSAEKAYDKSAAEPSGKPTEATNAGKTENKTENKSQNSGSAKAPSADNEKMNERMKAMIDALDIPKGYKAIFVETGLSDETYIEIKNGLQEGDVVLLPDVSSSQNNKAMTGGMPSGMGGMGGMAGGMNRMPGAMGGMTGGMNRTGGSFGNNRQNTGNMRR